MLINEYKFSTRLLVVTLWVIKFVLMVLACAIFFSVHKKNLVVHIATQIIHTPTKIVLGVARDNYAWIGLLGKYSLSNLKYQQTLIIIK